MEIKPDAQVFLIGHRGAIAPDVNSVMLELTIALTAEDAVARKGESFRLLVEATYAEKLISSLQTSLQRLSTWPRLP